ncbi:MAG TPA: peptidase U32, partial [Desulfotomaculum sp.]|nr:peptidase U32 [Desulfotomaculum sp.]
EMEEAVRFLRFIYESGADAAIIQDTGLLRLARRVVPELCLHASTQMTVHNAAGAALLRDAGVTRVILARELSLGEIESLKRETGIEVEVFVHGALCVCYSGQCLMSSVIGARSGNRGMCAQPCRLPYALTDEAGAPLAVPSETGEFLLSTKDLNLSRHLPALAAAGVDGLKIEGRLKRPEYVATVVRVYRCLLDRLADRDFHITPAETLALAQAFNRGFSPGYILGRPGGALMSWRRPNNRGVFLGRVLSYDHSRRAALIKLSLPLRVGDGVEFWVSEGGRVGTEVRRLVVGGQERPAAEAGEAVEVAVAGRIRPGDRVFKTADAALEREAQESFAGFRERKKIPLVFEVRAREGKPVTIRVRDNEGNSAEILTHSPAVPAEKRPLTWAVLREQLGRLGSTPFEMVALTGEIDAGLFVPVSALNEARRKAVDRIQDLRKRTLPPIADGKFAQRFTAALRIRSQGGVKAPCLAVSCGDLKAAEAALAAGADRVYFGGEEFRNRLREGTGPEVIREIGKSFSGRGRELFLLTPRITKDNELRAVVASIKEAGGWAAGVVAGNLGLLRELRRQTALAVWADYYLNIFNLQAIAFVQECGASGATVSPELTLAQVRKIAGRSPVPVEVFVHGRLPLMVSEYCLVGSVLGNMRLGRRCERPCSGKSFYLRDRLGALFPVVTDTACRMHILNSQELVMLRHLPALVQAGVFGLRIEARTRDAAYVTRVTRIYRRALDAVLTGARVDLEGLEKSLTEGTAFTRGHYFRGVTDNG